MTRNRPAAILACAAVLASCSVIQPTGGPSTLVSSSIGRSEAPRTAIAPGSPSPGFAHALQAALRAKLDEHANSDEQLVAAREALLEWLREDGL